jgi:tartrate dehydratase alpha subunit/fumarate hydratase class I-like protein
MTAIGAAAGHDTSLSVAMRTLCARSRREAVDVATGKGWL